MRIGIDGRYLEEDLVGVGNYIKFLVEELNKRGVECVIFYSQKPKYSIKGKNIISVVKKSLNRITFEQVTLPILFRKYKIDLYHAVGNIGVPLFSNIKSVLTVHDLIPITYKNYFDYSRFPFLSKFLYLFRIKSSILFASKIITVSEFTKNEVLGFGVPKEKIEVIYSGIAKIEDKLPNKNQYEDYVINNGGLDIRKNTDGLIKAFALLNNKFPKLKLVITGNNESFKKELENLAKDLRVSEKVIFTGYVGEEQLYSLIKNAKCLCYPSIIEGFGFPVLEAFALGTPVVSSSSSSLPEVAGNAALLVDPYNHEEIAEAIGKILKDKSLSEKLINLGHKQVQKFSWENTANKYMDIYKKLL